MTKIKKLKEILKHSSGFQIICEVKRMEENGIRDFYPRYCWKVWTDEKEYKSKCEGFKTEDEVIDDLIKNSEKIIHNS